MLAGRHVVTFIWGGNVDLDAYDLASNRRCPRPGVGLGRYRWLRHRMMPRGAAPLSLAMECLHDGCRYAAAIGYLVAVLDSPLAA